MEATQTQESAQIQEEYDQIQRVIKDNVLLLNHCHENGIGPEHVKYAVASMLGDGALSQEERCDLIRIAYKRKHFVNATGKDGQPRTDAVMAIIKEIIDSDIGEVDDLYLLAADPPETHTIPEADREEYDEWRRETGRLKIEKRADGAPIDWPEDRNWPGKPTEYEDC